jgi:ParB-like chromosome segregation protein Spo0J
MSLFNAAIQDLTEQLCSLLESVSESDRVEALNTIRRRLHQASPFCDQPVDLVEWIPAEKVQSNDYNPNAVAPPEMRLLAISIEEDGFTQPIVADTDGEICTVVDGFHRSRVGKENPRVRQRVKGYLPVTCIRPGQKGKPDRMASTIRHNRARGVHGVIPMTEVVAALIRAGWADDDVARSLGMDADEVLRFKQVKGLPELFKNNEYSRSWI